MYKLDWKVLAYFVVGIFLGTLLNLAHAQITHEVAMTAQIPLWYEISTSTDTITIKTNGRVIIQNPENNYGN